MAIPATDSIERRNVEAQRVLENAYQYDLAAITNDAGLQVGRWHVHVPHALTLSVALSLEASLVLQYVKQQLDQQLILVHVPASYMSRERRTQY